MTVPHAYSSSPARYRLGLTVLVALWWVGPAPMFSLARRRAPTASAKLGRARITTTVPKTAISSAATMSAREAKPATSVRKTAGPRASAAINIAIRRPSMEAKDRALNPSATRKSTRNVHSAQVIAGNATLGCATPTFVQMTMGNAAPA